MSINKPANNRGQKNQQDKPRIPNIFPEYKTHPVGVWRVIGPSPINVKQYFEVFYIASLAP